MEKEKDSKLKQAMKGLDSFLTTHYSFRYNQITEQCEFHDKHKFDKYRVVDEREFNTLVINAIEEGVNCMDRDRIESFYAGGCDYPKRVIDESVACPIRDKLSFGILRSCRIDSYYKAVGQAVVRALYA